MPSLRPSHQTIPLSTSFHRRPSTFGAEHVHSTRHEDFSYSSQMVGSGMTRMSYQAPRPAPAPPVPSRDRRRQSHAAPPLALASTAPTHHRHRSRQGSVSATIPFPTSHHPQVRGQEPLRSRHQQPSYQQKDRRDRDAKENVRPSRDRSSAPAPARTRYVEEPRHPGTIQQDTRGRKQMQTEAAAYVSRYRERDSSIVRPRKESGFGSLTRKIGAALSFGGKSDKEKEKALPPVPVSHYQTTTTRMRSASQQREVPPSRSSSQQRDARSSSQQRRPKVVSFSGLPSSSSKSKTRSHGPPITAYNSSGYQYSSYPGEGPSHRYPTTSYERERRQSDKKLGLIPVVFPALYGTGKHRAEFM